MLAPTGFSQAPPFGREVLSLNLHGLTEKWEGWEWVHPTPPAGGPWGLVQGVHTKTPTQSWHILMLPFPKYTLASATDLPSSPPCSIGGAYPFLTWFNWEQTFTSTASLPVTLYCEQCLSPSQGPTQVSLTLAATPGLQESGVDWLQAISRVHGGKQSPTAALPLLPVHPTRMSSHYNFTRAEKEQSLSLDQLMGAYWHP